MSTETPPHGTSTHLHEQGRIEAIRGAVVDVGFTSHQPPNNRMLLSGPEGEVVIEVAALLGPGLVRGLALDAERGLALGMPVRDIGALITIPVGQAVVGRCWTFSGSRSTVSRRSGTSSGGRSTAGHCRSRAARSAWRSSRPGSKPSTCSARSSAAARPGSSAARGVGKTVRPPHGQPRPAPRAIPDPALFSTEAFTGKSGAMVDLKTTIAGCERILDGAYGGRPERAICMIGALDEIREEGPGEAEAAPAAAAEAS